MHGIVKWFHSQKGFGFIEQRDGCKVFFRSSDLRLGGGVPAKGDEVEFEIEDFRLIPRAREVVLIGRARKAA